MGWMTFYKVLQGPTGPPGTAGGRQAENRLRSARKKPSRKGGGGRKIGMVLLSEPLQYRSRLLFLPLKNRCASRNECNGMQRYAMVCNGMQ